MIDISGDRAKPLTLFSLCDVVVVEPNERGLSMMSLFSSVSVENLKVDASSWLSVLYQAF